MPIKALKIVTFITLWLTSLFATIVVAAEKPLDKTKLLGLSLLESSNEDVKEHLRAIGGFLQADSTVSQRNFDKFFTWSRIRDSYYISFEYNNAGKITKAKRLYRPYSILNNNKRTALETIDVARQLIPDLGNPTTVQHKGWGGTLGYRSYRWEDDTMVIIVDREGSEKLGNIFIEYEIKQHDRYAVEKKAKKGDNV